MRTCSDPSNLVVLMPNYDADGSQDAFLSFLATLVAKSSDRIKVVDLDNSFDADALLADFERNKYPRRTR